MNCFDRDHAVLIVLKNHEGNHALWPQWKRLPAGWQAIPELCGDKASVLAGLERQRLNKPRSLAEYLTLGRTSPARLQPDIELPAEVDEGPATEPPAELDEGPPTVPAPWAWRDDVPTVPMPLAPTLPAQPRP